MVFKLGESIFSPSDEYEDGHCAMNVAAYLS